MIKRVQNLLFLLLSITAVGSAVQAQERPNIIIFIADDVSYNDLGCYGHPVIRTPNIDQLAAQGLRFTNAFLSTSSCSPSRISIITGRYPHNTGAAELHTTMPKNQIPFPRLLKEAGYYTAQAGKWHFGPDQPGEAMADAFDRKGGGAGDGGGSSGAGRWIEFVTTRPKDKPFFMWFAAHDAHRPWDSEDVPVTYKPEEAVVPPFLRDTERTREDLASYYNEVTRFDHSIGSVVAVLKEEGILDKTLIIIMADNGRPFPRNKTRLYDEGIKTPFVLHWPEGITSRGAVTTSLVSAVDIAPTLLEVAGVTVPQTVQGRSFQKLFHDPEQKFRNYVFAEHNWHDFKAHERMVRTERFLYIENGLPEADNRGAIDIMGGGAGRDLQAGLEQGILTGLQKDIFITPQPQTELYDCDSDSLQIHNLTFTRKFRRKRRQMAEVLQAWRQQTGDTQPQKLTGDWYNRISNKPLPEKGVRGTMPGAEKAAHEINHSGPF